MINHPNVIQTIEEKNKKLLLKKVSKLLFADRHYNNILDFFEAEYLTQDRIKRSLCKKKNWNL